MRAVWPEDAADVGAALAVTTGPRAATRPTTRLIFAALFKAAGADLIDCSSGQVSKAEQPVYGRLFQTPFADQIRNEVGIADHRGRRDLGGRPRQFDRRGRPRRSLRDRAPASRRPRLDAARGRPDRRERRCPGPSNMPPAKAPVRGQSRARRDSGDGRANERDRRDSARGATRSSPAPAAASARRSRARSPPKARASASPAAGARRWRRSRRACPGGATACRSTASTSPTRRPSPAACRRARAALGPLVILVNNAGEAPSAPFGKTDLAMWCACARGRPHRRLSGHARPRCPTC